LLDRIGGPTSWFKNFVGFRPLRFAPVSRHSNQASANARRPCRGENRAAGREAQAFGDAACESAFGVTAAPRYRQWEHELVAPFLGRSILEIGSGRGYFSEKLAEGCFERLILSDHDEQCLERLRQTYADRSDVCVTRITLPGRIDVGEPVESVVAMNVLEHIDDDTGALRDLAAVVRPGGRIVLWVPAYMQLYGDFDCKVGHFRRYTPATIGAVVERAGLRVRHARPVNFLGGVAWWVAVRRGGAGRPDPRLVWLYDNVLVPVSRTVERSLRPPFGQSVLCVADV
jgi:2-polyprenyl-3-methyl-5-hydroxy-6-metoxy-1,4-benzoquinol methylase